MMDMTWMITADIGSSFGLGLWTVFLAAPCLVCYLALVFSFSILSLLYTCQHDDSTLGAAWRLGRWVAQEVAIG